MDFYGEYVALSKNPALWFFCVLRVVNLFVSGLSCKTCGSDQMAEALTAE